MTTHLRPLNLGEILDRTAELYRTHFLLFVGIAAIFAAAMLCVQMLHLGVLALIGYPHVPPHLGWAYAVVLVVQVLIILLVAGLSIAAFNRTVAWVYLDQPATIRQAVRSVLPRIRRYLWLMAQTFLRAWAPLAVIYVLFFAIFFSVLPGDWMTNPSAIHTLQNQNPFALVEAGLGFLVLAPLLVLASVYGVLMSLRYSVAMPACVVEELGAAQAIKRSIELSKGARGRIFVLGLLVYAIRLVIGTVLGFPLIFFALRHVGQPLPLGIAAAAQIGGFITNTFIGPIYSTGLTLFYYDQRVRKEGFDIEWMMQAAGLSPQAGIPAPEQP